MKIYLAGPMRGYKDFNKPLFDLWTKELRSAGHIVFSPAERDEQIYGNINSEKGDLNDISGFSLREALAADTGWICTEADCVAMLPGWEHSAGARAEHALAAAIGLMIAYIGENGSGSGE